MDLRHEKRDGGKMECCCSEGDLAQSPSGRRAINPKASTTKSLLLLSRPLMMMVTAAVVDNADAFLV